MNASLPDEPIRFGGRIVAGVKPPRGRMGRSLAAAGRHAWVLAVAVAIIATLAVTAGIIRRDAGRGDRLRRAEIAAAVAPGAAAGVVGSPLGLLYGQPVTATEYAINGNLRDTLWQQATLLARLWPTPQARQLRTDAAILDARTVTLLGLLSRRELERANALENRTVAPLGQRVATELQAIGATLSQQSARADATASDDALFVVAVAAAALVLFMILLVFAERRHARHISERRDLVQSQERWRALFAHLQEIVILVDGQGQITYASTSLERWLGYSPAELEGHELSSIEHPEDHERLTRVLEQAAPLESTSLTHRLRAKDGFWHTLESVMVSLKHDPAVGAVLVAAHDVTKQAALEQERERLDLDRRVSQRLEAVGQLSAGIAHEINTPLQFVGDSIAFLKDAVEEVLLLIGLYRESLYVDTPIPVVERRQRMREAEDQADVEYLCERIPVAFGRTVEGIDRVRSIVQAMKRFSHASGTEMAAADINEAIETTLAVCRNEYKYVANVTVEFGELPPVECNIGELNQVFLNMIINAAQAIEEQVGAGGVQGTIKVSTRVQGSDVVIEIADDGPGIPAELLDRIYEPFFTTKEVGKGTGQGLALARTTIERHAGTLECTTAIGVGTTFTIRLPLERKAAEALATAA